MTRRRKNKERLRVACRAAIVAQSWIAASLRERYQNSSRRPRRIVGSNSLSFSRRNKNRLMPKLMKLFRDCPELAPWLERPEQLRLLARYAGAAKMGGAFRSVVDKKKVHELISRVGVPVWRYGIEKGDEGKLFVGNTNDFIAHMDRAGSKCVHAFLLQVAKDFYHELAFAGRLDWREAKRGVHSEADLTLIRTLLEEVSPTA